MKINIEVEIKGIKKNDFVNPDNGKVTPYYQVQLVNDSIWGVSETVYTGIKSGHVPKDLKLSFGDKGKVKIIVPADLGFELI